MVTHDFRCDKCNDWMLDVPVDSTKPFPCHCGGHMVWTPTKMNLSRVSDKPYEIDFDNYNTYEQRLKAAKMYFKRREEKGNLPKEFLDLPIEAFVPPGDGIDMQAHLEARHKESQAAIKSIDEDIKQADREMKNLSPERQKEITTAFKVKAATRGVGQDMSNVKVLSD